MSSYVKMNACFQKFHSTGNVNVTKTEKEGLVTIRIRPEGFYAQHKEETDEQQENKTESESSGGTMKRNKSEIEKCTDKGKICFQNAIEVYMHEFNKNKKLRGFMQSSFPLFVYFKCLSEFLLYFYKCSSWLLHSIGPSP